MPKPRIIVTSKDTDKVFGWMSDGWHAITAPHTAFTVEGKRLMALADRCIKAATDVPDAIRRLEEAGFEVVRKKKEEI
jgi:hypothetical protein